MLCRIRRFRSCCLPLLIGCFAIPAAAEETAAFTTAVSEHELQISLGGQAIATYVWHDEGLPRPHFRHLATPDSIPVTRNYPPDPVVDAGNDDHPHFHPGAWMAFGDISGADFWRNKARVRHLRLAGAPEADGERATFTAVNAWEAPGEPPRVLVEETVTYTFTREADGFLLAVDASFRAADGSVAFGDQEEMGLGVRLATPLSVRHGGGVLLNSAGGEQEAGTWGRAADWCAGFGMIGERRAGISVMASPHNFRPSWFHARDYGLITANPFGKKAMTAPKDPAVGEDSTPVADGESLRLRFGIYVFSVDGERAPDFGAMYRAYIGRAE